MNTNNIRRLLIAFGKMMTIHLVCNIINFTTLQKMKNIALNKKLCWGCLVVFKFHPKYGAVGCFFLEPLGARIHFILRKIRVFHNTHSIALWITNHKYYCICLVSLWWCQYWTKYMSPISHMKLIFIEKFSLLPGFESGTSPVPSQFATN